MKYEEKNIGILGLGKSGYWSAKLAKSLKNNVFVSDSNTNVNEVFVDDLKMLGIDVEIGIHSNQILESDLIIKSPGIPNDSEIMNKINSFSFQGVKGAYSELAGKNLYPEAVSLPCSTFEEMFEQVRLGNVDAAMVPIENSLAGRVADTQRLIPESNLKITFLP